MHIAVACGGTGGHIVPGLATAQELARRGHDVTLWLSGRAVEGATVKGWDGPVERVRAAGFPSGVNLRAIGVGVRLLIAVTQCRERMRRNRPDVLLAMGSYASIGPGLAAQGLQVPLVLHEANVVPGRAILLLSRFASAVAMAFDATREHFPGCRTELTGLPLRSDLEDRFAADELDTQPFTVLVMGGSQGARALNDVASEALCRLQTQGRGVQVLHLSGRADEATMRARYEAVGVAGRVYGFLNRMGAAYAAADVAICRSGAASCCELAACGVPALFVPLPSARRDHQAANAQAMAAAGAADIMSQNVMTSEALADYIDTIRQDPARREAMADAMRRLARPDAAARLADVVESQGAK